MTAPDPAAAAAHIVERVASRLTDTILTDSDITYTLTVDSDRTPSVDISADVRHLGHLYHVPDVASLRFSSTAAAAEAIATAYDHGGSALGDWIGRSEMSGDGAHRTASFDADIWPHAYIGLLAAGRAEWDRVGIYDVSDDYEGVDVASFYLDGNIVMTDVVASGAFATYAAAEIAAAVVVDEHGDRHATPPFHGVTVFAHGVSSTDVASRLAGLREDMSYTVSSDGVAKLVYRGETHGAFRIVPDDGREMAEAYSWLASRPGVTADGTGALSVPDHVMTELCDPCDGVGAYLEP